MNEGRLFRYVRTKTARFIYGPKVNIEPVKGIIRLGSDYGGWELLDDPDLHNAMIVSAGLGEDASFDVEFIKKYNAKVIMVDPTPKSIRHFERMEERFGSPAELAYVKGGRQPVESYDLTIVNSKNLRIVAKALWNREGIVSFFSPPSPDHVSHSITNFQNSYSQSTPHITVECTRLSSLLRAENVDVPKLLKLDIEGAEIEVLKTIVEDKIFPKQLLIEYDELTIPNRHSVARVNESISMLASVGYACVAFDKISNFLFLRQ